MKWFRNHWFDIGGLLAIVVIVFLFVYGTSLSYLQWLLWLNLVALWVHQLEEYKYPGTFPMMINTVLFKSEQPDRYPLNSNSSMIINAGGWVIYFFGALFLEKVLWMGIAAIMVSAGNFMAHTFLFNIKGKTFYNPGMLTSWLLFLPVVILFFMNVERYENIAVVTWIAGIALGMSVNVLIPILIRVWADKKTGFVFRR